MALQHTGEHILCTQFKMYEGLGGREAHLNLKALSW